MFDLVSECETDAIVVACALSKKLALRLVHEGIVDRHVHVLAQPTAGSAANVESTHPFDVVPKVQSGCIAVTSAHVRSPIARDLAPKIGVPLVDAGSSEETTAVIDRPLEAGTEPRFCSLPRIVRASRRRPLAFEQRNLDYKKEEVHEQLVMRL